MRQGIARTALQQAIGSSPSGGRSGSRKCRRCALNTNAPGPKEAVKGRDGKIFCHLQLLKRYKAGSVQNEATGAKQILWRYDHVLVRHVRIDGTWTDKLELEDSAKVEGCLLQRSLLKQGTASVPRVRIPHRFEELKRQAALADQEHPAVEAVVVARCNHVHCVVHECGRRLEIHDEGVCVNPHHPLEMLEVVLHDKNFRPLCILGGVQVEVVGVEQRDRMRVGIVEFVFQRQGVQLFVNLSILLARK
mmetsp:Transcript_28226/g.70856  ORF Transcript_28226/g.70856 Transcript_28226/m.70856 type:complete len:248 (+) Transcript_28226:38-781(+)